MLFILLGIEIFMILIAFFCASMADESGEYKEIFGFPVDTGKLKMFIVSFSVTQLILLALVFIILGIASVDNIKAR